MTMNIQGLNKLTLLDYPGRTAATIFIGGCNLRCPFCQNASLVRDGGRPGPPIDVEEVLAFLKKRRGLLDGVCITGGEPLANLSLPPFLTEIKALGYAVKLDTNGTFPERLEQLAHKGLIDGVAMDVKNAPAHYAETVGIINFDLAPVEKTMRWLEKQRFYVEFRTTVVREFHDAQRLVALVRWLKTKKPYYLQAFQNTGDLLQEGLHGYDETEMHQLLTAVQGDCPQARLRGVD